MELIVHSYIVNNTELVHNVQSDNLARLKQVKRLLTHLGYDVREDVFSERGYHSILFWSYLDRNYTTVPRRTHSVILNYLKIPKNNIAVQSPNIISTYATVLQSRTTARRRPSSPVRLMET